MKLYNKYKNGKSSQKLRRYMHDNRRNELEVLDIKC